MIQGLATKHQKPRLFAYLKIRRKCLSRLSVKTSQPGRLHCQYSFSKAALLQTLQDQMQRRLQDEDSTKTRESEEQKTSNLPDNSTASNNSMGGSLLFGSSFHPFTPHRPIGDIAQPASSPALSTIPQHFLDRPSRLPFFHRASPTSSSTSSKRSDLKSEETALGPAFQPGPWHVVSSLLKRLLFVNCNYY